MSNKGTRDTVVDPLPDDIKGNIGRGSAYREDVLNIVNTVLNYEDGLQALIEILRRLEGDSLSLRELDRLLA